MIDVIYQGDGGPWTVARVAQRASETIVEYTDEHVDHRAELAPIRHLIHERARVYAGPVPDQLPGLLADSLPDAWGRMVLRRDMRQHGIERPTALQMLTWLGQRTMGALTYRPVSSPEVPKAVLGDLDEAQASMLKVLAGNADGNAVAERLVTAAGSGAGGARPKLTVASTPDGKLVVDDGTVPPGATPWLVKFHGPDDSEYLSSVEATYLQMAALSGITTCEHTLLSGSSGTQYLAVRRFDRETVEGAQPRRIHMSTAAGLLETYPEHNQHLSYVELVRLTQHVTGDARDVMEIVRRAVFNVVAHNRDDHARNFAFLWTPGAGWRLAPAYDLTHSMGPRPTYLVDEPGEHYLDIAGKGAGIRRQDFHELARPGNLKTSQIDDMIDLALSTVESWAELATANGVSEQLVRQYAARLPALAL